MPISQAYFELRDIQALQGKSWIPLRQVVAIALEPAEAGIARVEEWTGIATAAVQEDHRTIAETMGWSDGVDLGPHRSGVEHWGYCAADVFMSDGLPIGVNLVVDQHIEQENRSVWHLHPDLVVALGLVREEDSWFRPDEGWVEVARLKRDESASPILLEIKAEFLGDYLAARRMALYCSSYRERVAVTAVKPLYSWKDDQMQEDSGRDCRECIMVETKHPDPLGHFWMRGALWRTEWVEPGTLSTRVRGDVDPHTTNFALENDGTRVTAAALIGKTSWLYFAPTIAAALMRHRGAKLRWATGETGLLGATAYGVHFGINQLGLVTVFAKDIGALQPWEQRIWGAHNVTPDGGVSDELFAAQMMVNPAGTVAPEHDMPAVLNHLDLAFEQRHGAALLRKHDDVPRLINRSHRFVAAEIDGVLELAKELTRLFMERVNVDAIIAAIGLPKGDKKPGSLKSLEKLVAHHRSEAEAAAMMAPLFGIYDLRLADAHLGSALVASGLSRAGVDDKLPAAMQGRQLIQSYVNTLRAIASVLA
ncbi:hypothetical protein MCELHM10_04158 [Paracoccaceae bacterium]